jgi:hypothetical protein
MVGVDARPGKEFLTGSGARQPADGGMRNGQVLMSCGEQGVADRRAEPPFGWWSSAITMRPELAFAAVVRIVASIGLME